MPDHGPILERMRSVEGWIYDCEAPLLIDGLSRAISETPEPHSVVEVGSYQGRSTVVLASVLQSLQLKDIKVYAIDPHNGEMSTEQPFRNTPPSLSQFQNNIESHGLTHYVELICKHSFEVPWNQPICFLFIDAIHEYSHVSRDFRHFEPYLMPGSYVAFHDYGGGFIGITQFVDELINTHVLETIKTGGGMILLRRLPV